MLARVSLVKGEDRYSNVRRALELIREDVRLQGARRILVKPNLTSATVQLAATHVDALRAVLTFLREGTSVPIVIAEGTGTGSAPTQVAFRNFGYYALEKEFGVELVDLNDDYGAEVQVFDAHLRPATIKVSRTLLESEYRVSVCPPKTHDAVVVTASLKNVLMAGPLRKQDAFSERMIAFAGRHLPKAMLNSTWMNRLKAHSPPSKGNHKLAIHQGYAAMNLNLFLLARLLRPHLAVIDGLHGMEGEGPVGGRAVPWGIALASVDSIAADTIAAKLMGFDPRQIGYLFYCHQAGLGQGDPERISILGQPLEPHIHPFQPHSAFQEQVKWRLPDVEGILVGEGYSLG